jgi:hypothetical protein
MRISFRLGLLAAGLSVLVPACSSSGPAEPSGYLERPDAMERVRGIPFQRIWSREGTNWEQYHSVCVAPTRTDYLMGRQIYSTGDSKRLAIQAGAKLETALRRRFEQQEKPRYRLVERPAVRTLLIELAIVEITPRLTSGSGSRTSTVRGTLAFEGRITDAATGTVLATMADRRMGPPVVLRPDMGHWGHLDGIVQGWARDLVDTLDQAGRRELPEHWPFDLKTWPRTRR